VVNGFTVFSTGQNTDRTVLQQTNKNSVSPEYESGFGITNYEYANTNKYYIL
jgi:hypothetical protein